MLLSVFLKSGVIAILIIYYGMMPIDSCFVTVYGLPSRNNSWLYWQLIGDFCVVLYAPSRAVEFSTKLMEHVPVNYNVTATEYLLVSLLVDLRGLLYVAFSGYILLRLTFYMTEINVSTNLPRKSTFTLPTAPSSVNRSKFRDFDAECSQNDSYYSI